MTDLEQIANKHWKYVEGLLQAYGVKTGTADEYMYISVFNHGFKHGIEHERGLRRELRDAMDEHPEVS